MLPECVLFKQVLRPIRLPAASAAVRPAGPRVDVKELTCFAKRQGNDFASGVVAGEAVCGGYLFLSARRILARGAEPAAVQHVVGRELR
jgi:hypothetical protein